MITIMKYLDQYSHNFSRDMTKPTKGLWAQRRLRSAWASAQSDQSLRRLHEETLGPFLHIERTAKTASLAFVCLFCTFWFLSLVSEAGCGLWSWHSLNFSIKCFCVNSFSIRDLATLLFPFFVRFISMSLSVFSPSRCHWKVTIYACGSSCTFPLSFLRICKIMIISCTWVATFG